MWHLRQQRAARRINDNITGRKSHCPQTSLVIWRLCMRFEMPTTDALSLFAALFCEVVTAGEARVLSWQAELWHWWYKAGQMFAWLKLVIMGQTESGLKMRLTCHYPDNKHAHVGTQRAGPEQAQCAVGFPARATKKEKKTIKGSIVIGSYMLYFKAG